MPLLKDIIDDSEYRCYYAPVAYERNSEEQGKSSYCIAPPIFSIRKVDQNACKECEQHIQLQPEYQIEHLF